MREPGLGGEGVSNGRRTEMKRPNYVRFSFEEQTKERKRASGGATHQRDRKCICDTERPMCFSRVGSIPSLIVIVYSRRTKRLVSILQKGLEGRHSWRVNLIASINRECNQWRGLTLFYPRNPRVFGRISIPPSNHRLLPFA